MTKEPTKRFSSRVDNYVKYRPGYPDEIVPLLASECGLRLDTVVADVGSGTGILTRLFLDNGNRTFAVEPNAPMRAAAEALLGADTNLVSVAGTAEDTGLESESIDLVTAGQAFHWFDACRARDEFRRVLRPGGWVVVIWNDRKTGATPFLGDYEEFLHTHGTDYAEVQHKTRKSEQLDKFFGAGEYQRRVFQNEQRFDCAGLRGRTLSSSYVPDQSHPRFSAMLAALEKVFERHARHGGVVFEYDTLVYYGQLG